MEIGDTIKTLRLKRDITQLDLARRLKVSQGFLSLIEKNDREPSFVLVRKIAAALKVPEQLIYLLSCESNPYQKRYSKQLSRIANALDDILNVVSQK